MLQGMPSLALRPLCKTRELNPLKSMACNVKEFEKQQLPVSVKNKLMNGTRYFSAQELIITASDKCPALK